MILDRYVEIQSKHQRHVIQDNYVIRFPKFDLARLHLYQGISARITPKCSLVKIAKDDMFVSQSVK